MKNSAIILGVFLFGAIHVFSQVSINSDGSTPDNSAMLDVKSTTQGLLIPRISTSARDLIPSPATGLLIYNTTANSFNYYNGGFWCQLETAFITSMEGILHPGGGISINAMPDAKPDSSAMLDVNNPTRGILIPGTSPELITGPATGLIIYNTATNMLNYFNGSQWITLCAVSTGVSGPGGSQSSLGMAIKTDNSEPHHSAILDISATSLGVLIPRLTNVQRDAIFPVTGLVIYNTSANSIEFYNGTAWYQLITSLLSPPVGGTQVPSMTQIIWNWNAVANATGYKWNTESVYATANDMGTETTKTETGLDCNNSYSRYVWAYNGCGNSTATILTQSASACVSSCGQTLTDSRDGKTYNTVLIGLQCWMAQNMNIGTKLPGVADQTNGGTFEKYCYGDLESNCNIYGGLYQWAEMMQYVTTAGVQGICPTGWHLPTAAEWAILTTYLGGELANGGKLKEAGTAHWLTPNSGATNSSGFTALPAGYRYPYNGALLGLTKYTYFWSSTQQSNDATHGWHRALGYDNWDIYGGYQDKVYGKSVRCVKDDCAIPPAAPGADNNIPYSTQIIWNWNTVAGAYGYKWSTVNDYATATDMGTATAKTETGLTCNTAYTRYAWAYNECTHSSASALTKTTISCASTCGQSITDNRDGKTYNTVQIGTQCWMAQNLNAGTKIAGTTNQMNNAIIEKYCFSDLESNCNVYGGLYQWNETMQYLTTEGVQGICPTGWHVPSDAEWTALETYLGGATGGKLKEVGTAHWAIPNAGATNSSGLTAIPTGYRYGSGSYNYLTSYANIWLSTQYSGTDAWYRYLHYNSVSSHRTHGLKTFGQAVRCLRD